MHQVDWGAESMQAAVPSTGLGLVILGVPISDWIAILALIVLILQAYTLLRNIFKGNK